MSFVIHALLNPGSARDAFEGTSPVESVFALREWQRGSLMYSRTLDIKLENTLHVKFAEAGTAPSELFSEEWCFQTWRNEGESCFVDAGHALAARSLTPKRFGKFGWTCGERPFEHGDDAIFDMVCFDCHKRCEARCNVSWEVEVPNGYFEIYIKLSFPAEGPPRSSSCYLNGKDLNRVDRKRFSGFYEGVFAGWFGVIASEGRIRLEGDRAGCGFLKETIISKPELPLGNRSCWNYNGFEYHTCCVRTNAPGSSRTPIENCWNEGLTFDLCCSTTGNVGLLQADWPLVPAPRGKCLVPGYCGNACIGESASYYDHPPAWVTDAPDPSPVTCPNGLQIWPYSYNVQEELIEPCIPEKAADFALLFPGDPATYIFDNSVTGILEYFRMYRLSLFGVTRIKGGFDSFRNMEILASGSVPYFIDIEAVSPNSLTHHRKDLLRRALDLPGVHLGYIAEGFNATAYLSVAQDLLLWTRHRLTTASMMKYVLRSTGIEDHEFPDLRVLFICDRIEPGKFSSTCVHPLHGLREILNPEHVVDYPYHENEYELRYDRPIGSPRPKGGPFYSTQWVLRRSDVRPDGESVLSSLRGGHFKLVLFGWIPGPISHTSAFSQEILATYPRKQIIAIDQHDHFPTFTAEWAQATTLFKLNIGDSAKVCSHLTQQMSVADRGI